jgi:hypothetical protein
LKYLLLIIIAGFFISFSPQQNEDLRKYSYLIRGFKVRKVASNGISKHTYTGTGFFIRKNGKVVLVTADHIFNKDASVMLQAYWVIVFNKKTNKQDSINIGDLSKIGKIQPDEYIKNYKDAIAIPITISGSYKINSIEKFLIPYNEDYRKIDHYINYSFPGNAKFPYLPTLDIGNVNADINSPLGYGKDGVLDTVAYPLISKSKKFDMGSSGSPVFFILKNNKIEFGGIGIAKSLPSLNIITIKPKIVYKVAMAALGTK